MELWGAGLQVPAWLVELVSTGELVVGNGGLDPVEAQAV
jgi:hypothetical protein